MSKEQVSLQVKIQRMGNFLSGMVMPNIGVFIAWGLITALFIPTGWFPANSSVTSSSTRPLTSAW